MAGGFIIASLIAGGCAYVVGTGIGARQGTLLRSPTGGILLALSTLVAMFLPPLVGSFARDGIPGGLYALWLLLLVAGFLAGMKIWRLRQGGSNVFGIDNVPVGRAASRLVVADSLDQALEILKTEHVTARELPNLIEPLRRVGSLYFLQ